jgi:preprotein translocase subunit SecE
MAVDVARPNGTARWGARLVGAVQGLPATYRSVVAEMRRVTWPDRTQIRQLSIAVIVLSLFIGGVIAAMDFTLQQVLVKWIPQLFAGR